jgi:TRAP-type mannitol/chloroaromatic compound transport system permease small subunit
MIRGFGKALYKIEIVFTAIGLLSILLIWALVFTSIMGRIFKFAVPQWEFQFTEMSLYGATLLSLAWILRKDRHVAVDIVIGNLCLKNKLLLLTFINFIGAIVSLIVTILGAHTVWSIYKTGVIEENVIDLPQWAIVLFIPLGFLLFSGEFIYKFLDSLKKVKAFNQAHQKNPVSHFSRGA